MIEIMCPILECYCLSVPTVYVKSLSFCIVSSTIVYGYLFVEQLAKRSEVLCFVDVSVSTFINLC